MVPGLSLARQLFSKSCIPDVLVHVYVTTHHRLNAEGFSTNSTIGHLAHQLLTLNTCQIQAWLINRHPRHSGRKWAWSAGIFDLQNLFPRKFCPSKIWHYTVSSITININLYSYTVGLPRTQALSHSEKR